MPTYLYSCPDCGEFEYIHSIKDHLELCPHCLEKEKKEQPVIRLIASGGSFILNGSGWAKDNYANSK